MKCKLVEIRELLMISKRFRKMSLKYELASFDVLN